MEKGSYGKFGAVLMDLSKAFDTINHELLIAKLEAYGFHDSALHILLDYLSDRWLRVKVNATFSDWRELLSGVPQASLTQSKGGTGWALIPLHPSLSSRNGIQTSIEFRSNS